MRWVAFSLIILFLLPGCEGFHSASESTSVWVPWPNEQGEYQWQNVRLLSRRDPTSLESFAANVYWRAGGSPSGFKGSVVHPHTLRNGNSWLALDSESLISVTALLIFERIEAFDRALGISHFLSWPRNVGIDIQARSSVRRILNNAFYDDRSDSVVITPYLGDTMPMALNHGIIAHEHFHAYFTRSMVEVGLGQWLGETKSQSLKELTNQAIVLSWNEGLADFYGAVFSGDSRFVGRTFSDLKEKRNLEGDIKPLKGRSEIQKNLRCLSDCPAQAIENVDPYDDGQSLARFLFLWYRELSLTQRERLVKEVVSNLSGILRQLRSADSLAPSDWPMLFLAKSSMPKPVAVCQAALRLMEKSERASISGCAL